MQQITGNTRVYAILADPIHHVQTPRLMNELIVRRGHDGIMVPFHVTAADLPTLVAGLKRLRSFAGFIATVPHKTAMLSLCDSVSRQAELVGAVNCVRREDDGRFVGEILDGAGFVAGLRRDGFEPGGCRVLLLGAGGAANAIAFALADAGIVHLTIANRTRSKSADLARRLAGEYPGLAIDLDGRDVADHDLIVNGTSLGLSEADPLPIDVAGLSAAQTVAEIIMQPRVTRLLAAAQAKGCGTHYGLPMLECQLAMMADFMGVPT